MTDKIYGNGMYTYLEVEDDGPYETKYNRGFAIGNVGYIDIYKFNLKQKM